MISDKTVRLLKNNTGSASVIEAVLVYPAVIIVCIFLVYSGMFMFEESLLYDIAEKAASEQADAFSSGNISLQEYSGKLKRTDIEKACKDRRSRDIRKDKKELVRKTEERVGKMLLRQKKPECSIDISYGLQGIKITADIERKVCLPEVLMIFSEDDCVSVRAAATVLYSDYCELLRENEIVTKGKKENESG